MSTYIDARNPNKHDAYDNCPKLVSEYLKNMEAIRGLSARSVNGYYIDLTTFFRFIKKSRNEVDENTDDKDINLLTIDLDYISSVSRNEIYEFLYYVTNERNNAPSTRARKLSSIKGFYKYLCNKMKLIDTNPTDDVEAPVNKKSLPKYLNLSESMKLLQSVNSDFYERDFCILLLFLSCGMRLSELVNINIININFDDSTIRIIGKGNKERLVYLSQSCLEAIIQLQNELKNLKNLKDKKALFVSKRTGNRLSARRIQQIINDCLSAAGLSGRGFSAHKLRHTAATMMYQEGGVDMLALKEILGHAHVSTTEIYTHLGAKELKKAAEASPFSKVTSQKSKG